MTFTWAFLAELDPQGSLEWKGNLPRSLGLPKLGDYAFSTILELAKAGKFGGRQVDWGAWAIKVNGPQLQEVLDKCVTHRQFFKDHGEKIEAYRKFAGEIGEGNSVAFVAAEL
jgi:hypothetical protein